MIKKVGISLLVIFLVFILLLIGFFIYIKFSKPPKPLNNHVIEQINKEYPTWFNAIDILDNKQVSIIGYNGEIGSSDIPYESKKISLNIKCSPEYMKSVVEKDTNFIKENPSYFDEKLERKIYYYYKKGSVKKGECFGYKNYIDTSNKDIDLNYTKDGALRVWFTNSTYKIESDEVSDNVEVVEVFDVEKNDYYDLLLNDERHQIKNLKYIILHKADNETDVDTLDAFKRGWKQIYPNVEIIVLEPEEKQ